MSEDDIEAIFEEAANAAGAAFGDYARNYAERHPNVFVPYTPTPHEIAGAIGAAVAAGIAAARDRGAA